MNLGISLKFKVYKSIHGKWCLYCPVHSTVEETKSQQDALNLIPGHLRFTHNGTEPKWIVIPPPVGELKKFGAPRVERSKKNLQKDGNDRASSVP